MVEVIPSPSGSEAEGKVPVNVVTRAQAKQKGIEKKNEENSDSNKSSGIKSTRKIIRDKVRAQYHKKIKTIIAELSKSQEHLHQTQGMSSSVILEDIPTPKPETKDHEPKGNSSRGSVS